MIIDKDEHGTQIVRFTLAAEDRIVALKWVEPGVVSCSSYPAHYVGTAMISFGPDKVSDSEAVSYLISQSHAGQEIARLKALLHLAELSTSALKARNEELHTLAKGRLKRMQSMRATIVEYERIAAKGGEE